MRKQNEKIKPIEAVFQCRWHSLLSLLRKSLYGLVLALYGAAVISSCTTVKYIPVKGETTVEYRDSIVTKLDTITVTRTEIQRVRDYTGMLDTLRLETKTARATAYLDTAARAIKGSLEDKEVPMQVVVPSKEEYHQRDSVERVEVPIPVEVEKVVEVVPKFWRVVGLLGIIETLVLFFLGFLKIKKKGLKNIIPIRF